MIVDVLRFIYARSRFLCSKRGSVVIVVGEAVGGLVAAVTIAATGVGAIALAWAAIPAILAILWSIAMTAPTESKVRWTRLSDPRSDYRSADVFVDHRPPIY